MSKQEYHVANFSGGKDSTAMVLHMIERGDPLDEVMFCDTTMEFPGMIRHIEKVKQVVEEAGIKFTTLRSERDFEFYLTDHQPKRQEGDRYYNKPGYGWPGVFSRWCTKALKIKIIDDYVRELSKRYTVQRYIGLAADEVHRLERKTNQGLQLHYPLVDWGWAEADALAYCYERGYDWDGLYNIFNRVSCWCCPLQSLADLRKLREHFPDLWQRLQRLDARQCKPYKGGRTAKDLEQRFEMEDALTAAGHSIKNRSFHTDHRRLLAGETTIDEILQERNKK